MSVTGASTYAELAGVLETLPVILRETRRARGTSLRECARQMGLSFSTVRRIESGEDAVMSNVVVVMRWIDQTGRPS
jgi:transcriptional regulator with XRE-family HTH domain